MAWLFLAIAAAAFLGPLAALLGNLDPAQLRETLASASFWRGVQSTAISGAGGAAISVALGALFARHFAVGSWRGKRLQRLGLLFPYLLPNFVLATAYVIAWNPGTGLLNSWVRFPGGLYGTLGMTWLFGVVHVPVAFLLLEDRFARIDASWREAARLSGASTALTALKIELPLVLPAIASAFALCCALNMSAFAIPAWIGAPEHSYTLTYRIYQAMQLGGADGIPQAAGLSLFLIALSAIPLVLGAIAQRRERKLVGGKASRKSELVPSRRAQLAFQALYWVLQAVAWILPMGCLALSTLVKPGCLQQNGFACLKEASLGSYHYVLFDLTETPVALRGSLLYGTIAALLIVAFSIVSLAALARSPLAKRVFDWIIAVPVATPGAILALGLIVSCSGRYGFNLYNTAWIGVVAFVLKHQSLSYQPLRGGLGAISPSLVEAARLSGATSRSIWTRILLPILKPELLGGFFLVLIPILGELTMSIFLASPSFRTIGTVLFDLQDYADQASAGALAILLAILVLALNEVARKLSRGKFGY